MTLLCTLFQVPNISHVALSWLLFQHVAKRKWACNYSHTHKGGHGFRFTGMIDVCTSFIKMQDGWRSTNDLVKNMKDIHEVKVTQSLSFNRIHCRGVAARAGSVHLIYSMDQKLGGARTHPQQHHPVPQGCPFSNDRPPKSTNNANSTVQPGQHQKAHNNIPPHSPLPVWVEQVNLHTINNLSHTDSLSSSQTVPAIPAGSSTSLTDWTELEGLYQAKRGRGKGQRTHWVRTRPLPLSGPRAKHCSRKPSPTWGIKASITHELHTGN